MIPIPSRETALAYAERGSTTSSLAENPKGSLFSIRGISSHLISPETLDDFDNNNRLFCQFPLIKELHKQGFPIDSINNLLKCGTQQDFMVAKCGCGQRVIPITSHCDLRVCPNCSQRRKRRLRRRYFPFLTGYKPNRLDSFYFLTISPKNYPDLEYGLDHIKKSFSKFRRHKYIAERIKGGMYVIESKEKEDGTWNIHIHAIVYGRRLDNRIRGSCLDCKQNLIKFDYIGKKYYCGNRKCNSINLIVKKDSKIVSLWMKASGMEVNIDIKRQSTVSFTLNYMLKYVSANKDDFRNDEGLARYITVTRNVRLVNTFGLFYKAKIPPLGSMPCMCPKCNEQIEFFYDNELVYELQNPKRPPPFPPEKISFEVIKIT